jgi:hypothetical protein
MHRVRKMRKASLTLIALVATTAALLGGCQSMRDAAGLGKKPPDEFAVTTKAPLVIPPGYNLMPPSPGAAPTNSLATDAQAQAAMFSAGDATAVAANLQGNYSPAERMLLATAGANRADPGIRQMLQSDQNKMQGADPSFTAKLMGTAAQPNNGQTIDANSELERRRGAARPAASKESSGWFDWF